MPSTPPIKISDSLKLPSLHRRMACWLYESLILFSVLIVFGLIFSTVGLILSHPLKPTHLQSLLFIVLGIYFSYFWSHGQTVAMKTWKIQILDTQGKKITKLRALLRYTLYCAWIAIPLTTLRLLEFKITETVSLMLLWIMIWTLVSRLNQKKQFIYEVLSGTLLIEDKVKQ